MSILSKAIGKRIQELGLAQKDVAVAFHGALGKLSKKGKGVDFKTVPPKISKLLKGSAEGESFLFASDARVAAMAEALQWKPMHLNSLWESSRSHRVLVLDPGLWEEHSAFLKRQEAAAEGRYSCVEVSVDGGDPVSRRDALRRAADANPGCLVVMEKDDDLDYYAGAKITVTKLERRLRGWSLVAAPSLVPQPPPDPPRQADHDGMPMVNPPGFMAALETEIEKHQKPSEYYSGIFRDKKTFAAVQATLGSARQVEQDPTFRIDHLFDWIRRNFLPDAKLRFVSLKPAGYGEPELDVATASVIYAAITGKPEETLVWTHGGRAFALGPAQQAFSRAFQLSGDPVPTPASLMRLKKYLPHGNPWQHEKKQWKKLCQEIAEECGVDIEPAYARWLEAVDVEKRDREISDENFNRDKKPPRTWALRLRDETNIKKTRVELRKLAHREFAVTWRASHLPFVLEAIAVAPLIALPIEGHDIVHAVANLGAGNVLRIRVMRFSGEQAAPLRPVDGAWYWSQLDGDNVHVWIQTWHDGLLDGQPLSRVLHRREDAQRAQNAMDDDD